MLRHPLQEPDDWGLDLEPVRKALKELDTGRWDWDKIDCCMTGKDADLEPWGQQGIELLGCNEDGVQFIVHGGKTEAGDDVCLNEPEGMSEEDYYRYRDAYLEIACELVCGTNAEGYWSGDDWYLSTSIESSVPWVYGEDGVTPDYEATAQAIYDKAQEEIKGFESEMCYLSQSTNILAGWIEVDPETEKETRCPAGKPGPYSIFGEFYQPKASNPQSE